MKKIIFVSIFIGQVFFNNILAASYESSNKGNSLLDDSVFKLNLDFFNKSNTLKDSADRNYLSLIELLKERKFKKAKEEVNKLLAKDSKQWRYYNFRALLYVIDKNNRLAQEDYLKSIDINGRNIVAYEGLAKIAITEKHYKKARGYLTKALKADEKYMGAYEMLAVLADMDGDKKQAEQYLLNGIEKAQTFNAELKMVSLLRDLYLMQKQHEKASDMLKLFAYKYPDKEIVHLLYSRSLFLVNSDKAEKELQKMSHLNDKKVIYRVALAKLKARKDDGMNESLQLLHEALAIEPSNLAALIVKAKVHTKFGDYSKALDVINIISKQKPENALSDKLAANIYIIQKKYYDALESYENAFKKKPESPSLVSIANILGKLGKVKDAISLLEKSKFIGVESLAVNFKLANLYEQVDDFDKAEVFYKKMLDVQPDNILALNNLAVLLAKKNIENAFEYAKRAYKIKPNSPAIMDTYGYILAKKGNIENAFNLLNKAAILAPVDKNIQYHLAEISYLMGKEAKAISLLKNILIADESFDSKEAAQNLLKQISKSEGESL